MLLRGAEVWTVHGRQRLDVRVVGETIADLAPAGSLEPDDETIDLESRHLLPGLIDAHVHFREPGAHAHKATYASESRAAAAGGVTTVLTMPNTVPPTRDEATLAEARRCAERSIVDHGFHVYVDADNLEFLRRAPNIAGCKLYLNETTGVASPLCDVDVVGRVLALGRPVVAHAEGETLDWLLGLHGSRGTGPLHIAHVALGREVAAIRNAKRRGQTVTAEATPHHLFLTEADAERLGAIADMRPTLKSPEDQAELWRGIADGTIDLVATDHAPHTLAEKRSASPPPGVIGLQTLLPLLLLAHQQGRLSPARLVALTSWNPARVFGLQGKGALRVGADADLVVVEPTAITIRNDDQFSQAGFTPFDGCSGFGRVQRTMRRGTWIYADGEILVDGGGREVSISR